MLIFSRKFREESVCLMDPRADPVLVLPSARMPFGRIFFEVVQFHFNFTSISTSMSVHELLKHQNRVRIRLVSLSSAKLHFDQVACNDKMVQDILSQVT